jgi:hypothetical protein
MWIWYRHCSWSLEVGWKEKYQEGRLWIKKKRHKYSKDVCCVLQAEQEKGSSCWQAVQLKYALCFRQKSGKEAVVLVP